MQPFRYITDVASTYTLRPSKSKTLSIMPALFSNCMEYEKPEQPPPTTPTRNPAGTGFCCVMISFTFATAFVVSVIGAVFFTSGVPVVGVVIVAMFFSLNDLTHYSRGLEGAGQIGRPQTSAEYSLTPVC